MTSDKPSFMIAGHSTSGIAYLFFACGFFLLLPYLITGEDGFALCGFPMLFSIATGAMFLLVAQVLFLFVNNISHEVRKRQLIGTNINLTAFLVFLGLAALVVSIASMELFDLEIAGEILIFGMISIPLIMGVGSFFQSAPLWEHAQEKKIRSNWKYSLISLFLAIFTFIFIGIFMFFAIRDPGRDMPLDGDDSFYRAFLGIYFMSLLMMFSMSSCIHFSLGRNLSKGKIIVTDDEED